MLQISQYNNDVRRRGLKAQMEPFISSSVNLIYSNYYDILYEYLKYFHPSQILLVQTEALSTVPQTTLDTVREHFGLPPRVVNPFWGNKGQGERGYKDPDKTIHQPTLQKISLWNEKLFNLLGVRFEWKMSSQFGVH